VFSRKGAIFAFTLILPMLFHKQIILPNKRAILFDKTRNICYNDVIIILWKFLEDFIMATRPIELHEYQEVIKLLLNGFTKKDGNIFRPNKQIALALQLQASLGLRIGDVLSLRVNNFKNGKLEIKEDKTDKLQYRDINSNVYNYIKDYAIDNTLAQTDKLFKIKVRVVQNQLKLITDYLGLDNISTHSFRKMYATTVYENNNHNLELVKELLNHTSIATTQRYIRVSQQAINQASAGVNFIDFGEESGAP
jgi:integrase